MLAHILLLIVKCVVLVLGEYDGFRSVYSTTKIIEADGYIAETHTVMTDDGYMLEMQRIPYKMNETSGPPDRPVVFIMHAILLTSGSFILLGPQYSIAYNLADAGFDVWMGNARGNRNSRRHRTMNPEGPNRTVFFDFTWEDIAYYDLSAMVDYILINTENKKLHYIGHSQGGTVFMVLNSMRPEYNEKFITAHLLAGVGYMEHFPNRLLISLAMFTNSIYSLALRMRIVEVFPPRKRSENRRNDDEKLPVENFDFNCEGDYSCRSVHMCTGDAKQRDMCELFGLEEILSPRILDNIDAEWDHGGASLKQIAHYGQNVQDKSFRRWNYGAMENYKKYNSHVPPTYDLGLITVNVTMHYTVGDNLVDEKDVLNMCGAMRNCVVRKVARESFGHADFVTAGDVKELVTDYIIEHMLDAHGPFNEISSDEWELSSVRTESKNSTQSSQSSVIAPAIMIKIYLSVYISYSLFL